MEFCKGLEDLRRNIVSSINEGRLIALSGGNKAESDINKQLINAAAFLIPVVFSLANIQEVRQHLNPTSGLMIKISIIFMFFSLLSGFVYILFTKLFYDKWVKLQENKLKPWATISFFPADPKKLESYLQEYEEVRKLVNSMGGIEPDVASTISLFVQATLWIIGVVFLIIVTFQLIP